MSLVAKVLKLNKFSVDTSAGDLFNSQYADADITKLVVGNTYTFETKKSKTNSKLYIGSFELAEDASVATQQKSLVEVYDKSFQPKEKQGSSFEQKKNMRILVQNGFAAVVPAAISHSNTETEFNEKLEKFGCSYVETVLKNYGDFWKE